MSSNDSRSNEMEESAAVRRLAKTRRYWPFGSTIGREGSAIGEFKEARGFCLSDDDMIVVADTGNHRIQVFDFHGSLAFWFGTSGFEDGQLWRPRKVALLPTAQYVVCDQGTERSRMQIFDIYGHFVRKIMINYINTVAGMVVSSRGELVVVDSVSPAVFFIAADSGLIRWFACSKTYTQEPSDIAVTDMECFICDFKLHCVVVYSMVGQFLRRIGTNTITKFPNGIDISDAGDVLVGDSHGNRFHVAVFQRDGSLIGNFECPLYSVSRCCGLKLTKNSSIVTLARHNHFILKVSTHVVRSHQAD